MSEDISGITGDWGVAVILQTGVMPAEDYPKTHRKVPMAKQNKTKKNNGMAQALRMTFGVLSVRIYDGDIVILTGSRITYDILLGMSVRDFLGWVN